MYKRLSAAFCLVFFAIGTASAQPGSGTKWTPDGNGYYLAEDRGIVRFDLKTQEATVVVPSSEITPENASSPLEVENFTFTADQKSLLVYTNSQKVWRYNTRGDYWLLDRENKDLKQLGHGFEPGTLMFAKVSPDGKKVAYVHQRNIYVEDLKSGKIDKITRTGGNPSLINGTFDWAYEEEFSCYDGFRWGANSRQIAYWQLDASGIRDFNIINYTDDIYSKVIPIEYPKVGQPPSVCRIGVVDLKKKKTVWMKVPGDPQQHYIPRMEWAPNGKVMMQQLDRRQQVSKLFYGDPENGAVQLVFEESDDAWVDVRTIWHEDEPAGWEWINEGREFLWVSEKDGWNHIYRISQDGKEVRTVTGGDYDVIDPLMYDDHTGQVYFTASPDNSMQRYLYAIKVSTESRAERITPPKQQGTNGYDISSNGLYAMHSFSNYYTPRCTEWVTLPGHKSLVPESGVESKILEENKEASNVEFIHVKTASGVDIDGWMAYPKDFDPSKKYATVFFVYAEPAGQTAKDNFHAGKNSLYKGSMAEDGYIYISVDGRGTPAPKGRAWRKAIYKNIGIINIKDQAEAAMALMEKYPFIDKSRIAVHGWSGGGSTTLNLLFKYPEVYQTGIAVAAVANQLTYDNIYQERYMGVPPEDLDAFVEGSPITHAKNLQGNLLYIHGTGDDNVHYQNAEMLLNELIKHNKQFQFMAYPNRTHGIYEGEGTREHLNTLFTEYLKEHCPPGPKDQ